MKFVCERCQTRYSIADDKVRQKILKIRCKTCDHVITVRELGAGAALAAGAEESGGGVERPALVAQPGLTGGQVTTPGSVGRAPAPGSAGRAMPPPPRGKPEWFFSIDGQQQGPLDIAEVARRIIAADRDADVYVWRADFDAWKELAQVAAVATEVKAQRARAAPPRPPLPPGLPLLSRGGTPGRAAVPSPGRPATGSNLPTLGGSGPKSSSAVLAARSAPEEFEEGGATQIQPLDASFLASDHVRPKTGGFATATPGLQSEPPAALRRTPGSGLRRRPPSHSSLDTPMPDLAYLVPPPAVEDSPPVSGIPSLHNGRGRSLFPDPIGAGPVGTGAGRFFPGPATGGPVPSMSAPSGLSQIRQVGGVFVRYPFLRYVFAGSVVVVLLLGILMVTLQRYENLGEKAKPTPVAAAQSGEDPEARARREAEQLFRSTVGAPRSTSKTVAVRRGPSTAPAAKAAPGSKPEPTAVEPPRASTEPPSAVPQTDEQQVASKRFAETERRVTAARPGSSAGSATAKSDNFSEADVRAVIKHNEASIKTCYERALKRDERLRTGRLDVNVTVGISGMVKAVSVNAPPEFSGVGACVKEAVRRWRFPAGREEYEVPFPLLLQGTG